MAPRVSFPVSPFRRFVDQLVKSRIYVICELDLSNRLHPLRSASDSEAHDPLFAKRRIEYSFRAELSSEIHTTPEDTSEGNIFAKHQGALIGAERMLEGGIDSLEEVLTGEGGRLGIGRVGAEGGWTMMEERMREVVYWNV